MHLMGAWGNENQKQFQDSRESLGASDCIQVPSAVDRGGGSNPRGSQGKGKSHSEEDWSSAGSERKEGSSEEEDEKLTDLRKRPPWGSHSVPSSPRYVHSRSEEKSTQQSIPCPLAPHPQRNDRQRQASHDPLAVGSCNGKRFWAPPTPRRREMKIRNGLDIKLDLAAVQRLRDAVEPSEEQLKRGKFAYFDKDCSRIAEHLYIGSDAVARNRETLLANKITNVLNCVGFACPEYFPDDFKYMTLWLQDSPFEDITSILYDVFDYFEEVRELGGRIFVHCCQGVSRSTSLVIAYLMWRKHRSFEDAFRDVKAARGVTNPNMGFACQLLQCQKRVHAAPFSPNSVLRMYRMTPHSPYDPLHLVPKAVSNPGPAALDSRGAFVVHIPVAIFIWVGKCCNVGMDSAAKTAAGQVVKYERAEGTISFIQEGKEPQEFWDALNKGCGSVEGFDRSCIESKSYDVDYEVYRRALEGGVVPPSNRLTKHVPTRDSGWSRRHGQVSAGCVRDISTPEAQDSKSGNRTFISTNPKVLEEMPEQKGIATALKGAKISADSGLLVDRPASPDLGSSGPILSTSSSPSVSIESTSSPYPKTSSSTGSSESSSRPFGFSFSNRLQTDHLPNQLDSTLPSKASLISLAPRRNSTSDSLKLSSLVDDPLTPESPSKSPTLPSLPSHDKQKNLLYPRRDGTMQLIEELPSLFSGILDHNESETTEGIFNFDFEQDESGDSSKIRLSKGMTTMQLRCSSITQMPRTDLTNPKIVERFSDASTEPTWQKFSHPATQKSKINQKCMLGQV